MEALWIELVLLHLSLYQDKVGRWMVLVEGEGVGAIEHDVENQELGIHADLLH